MTNTKLLYDPKRLLKLQKNEILNEFRVRFSQEFYKTTKEAEKRIWNAQDENFQFLEEIVSALQNELDQIQNSLEQRVKAWSSVEEVETKNTIKIAAKTPTQKNFANIQLNSGSPKLDMSPQENNFEDFDFFDEN